MITFEAFVHKMNWIFVLVVGAVFMQSGVTTVDGQTANATDSNAVIFSSASAQNANEESSEGDSCTKEGREGACLVISKCNSAIRDLAVKKQPQICFFKGLEPVVCCLDGGAPSAATPMSDGRPQTTTEYTPPEYDYVSNANESTDGCESIPAHLTSPKTGRKAWDKCIEFQGNYVYVCEKRVAIGESNIRLNYCGHTTDSPGSGGVKAKAGEFPHMALLGYGSDAETAKWHCGGTIISENVVMTAAHCTRTRDYGPVHFIRIALLRRSDPLGSNLYKVGKIITHPDYTPPKKYNDLALLQTETQMALNRYAVPACLPVSGPFNDSVAVAIGFGTTGFQGEHSNNLQKVALTKFSHEECSEIYSVTRHIPNGILENQHLCYGDKNVAKDTCQGDSGGPLHIYNKNVDCMYTVLGVISFGRGCGIVGVPGIFTRVENYVPWIESVAWPN